MTERNIRYPENFDEPDRQFLNSIHSIPDGALVDGYIVVVSFVDPDTGASRWQLVNNADLPVSQSVGLIELAKLELLQRTPHSSIVTGMGQAEPEE